jgi:hypothetical protein
MADLFADLVEYTGRDPSLVRWRCETAGVELAWQWEKYKDNPLAFYRESDLYIFDLTNYQSALKTHGFHKRLAELIFYYGWKTGLDYGGGIGEYTLTAAMCNTAMSFLEVKDSSTLKYAQWRFKKYGIEPTILDENYSLDRNYDFIVIMDVLEHLPDPQPLVKTLAEHTPYIFANPEQIKYNNLYPQHIGHYQLNTHFQQIETYLWQRK